MPGGHRDILDQRDSLGRPLAGSLVLHGLLFASVAAYSLLLQGARERWGDPNSLGGGGFSVTPVDQIPLPQVGGVANPVANDTESRVPAPPKQDQKKRAPAEDPDAISLKTKRDAFAIPPVWRFDPVWENYVRVLESPGFREAIGKHRKTRWAWIGLGASEMLRGNLLQAQKTWKKGLKLSGFAGPTLYVYRGECYRRQGKDDLARRDLQTAVQEKPERISAWINLALLDREPQTLQRVHAECTAAFPLLMEHLGGDVPEQLEGVLAAMRGNRRSSPSHVSYHLWGRVWRRVA